ncbi:bestrophin, RFP-TM, chloride channel domain-containing protein [Ditylenchus destructor]|uniref:Bestrophin homolog n=1 Tax=Ditylenchus destructor TaxID=166010 RepID=A0AAD4R1C2_9BILA|nr:bestrophin, RFP-TM, chloride channel domain-containing protein [Ditylenchus destructor]
MTVSYNLTVSTSRWWTWSKVMLRWRGSMWKSVLTELSIWTFTYYMVFVTYIFLPKPLQHTFVFIANHIEKTMTEYIHTPLRLMLAFFVAFVVDRWKKIFHNMGFVDGAAFYIATYVRGDDKETKVARRNLIRYMVLTQILVLRDICQSVRDRFPTLDSIVIAGFLQPHELEMLENNQDQVARCWMPVSWSYSLTYRLWGQKKIQTDRFCHMVLGSIEGFCENLHNLRNYDWVPVPLAYPQVVYLCVHTYFILCLITRQFTHLETHTSQGIASADEPETSEPYDAKDLYVTHYYVPFMTMLQYIFYVGWLKVGEALLNPLGNDDDDFECNSVINENLSLGLTVVDDSYDVIPDQKPDTFDRTNIRRSIVQREGGRWSKMLIGSAAKADKVTDVRNRKCSRISEILPEIPENYEVSPRRCRSERANGSQPAV